VLDPYRNDPQRWGVSLAQLGELLIACLDATRARSVVEVGAFAGDLTQVLVDWAAGSGARVQAIDPAPREGLLALERASPQLELIRRKSLEALPAIAMADVVIIDGDHNYYTVTEELRLIGARAGDERLPLLLFHDVAWPHGRRDDYFAADELPDGAHHPVVGSSGGIAPGDRGVRPDGLPYPGSAAHEGGPRNGVLTAIEDFVAGRQTLRLAVVPAFFGFAAVWSRAAPWAEALAALVDPWDRNPLLARLEANRIEHLARGYAAQVEVWRLRERLARHEALLTRLLESRAVTVAERMSHLRVRAGVAPQQSAISKAEIRRVLES
jgi:hypothetical protein